MTEAVLREALRAVVDPCSIATGAPIDIVDMGLVRSARIRDDVGVVSLRLTHPFCMQAANIADGVRDAIRGLGLEAVVEIDQADEWWPTMMAPEARERLRRIRP